MPPCVFVLEITFLLLSWLWWFKSWYTKKLYWSLESKCACKFDICRLGTCKFIISKPWARWLDQSWHSPLTLFNLWEPIVMSLNVDKLCQLRFSDEYSHYAHSNNCFLYFNALDLESSLKHSICILRNSCHIKLPLTMFAIWVNIFSLVGNTSHKH